MKETWSSLCKSAFSKCLGEGTTPSPAACRSREHNGLLCQSQRKPIAFRLLLVTFIEHLPYAKDL